MCDDREDSFCEKNSIAEFEMLEKECFQDETAPTQNLQSKPNGTKPMKKVNGLDLKKVHARSPSGRKGISNLKPAKNTTATPKAVQIVEDSPVRQSAREILNNLKSASTDKNSNGGS